MVAERQRHLTVYEDQVGSTPIHFANCSTQLTFRGVAKSGLKRSALTREIESSNLSSPANLIMCYIDIVNRALSLSFLLRRYWSSLLSSYCSL